MTPELALFAIRGLVRVGAAARDAYAQSVRDRDRLIPGVPTFERDPMDAVKELFDLPPHNALVGDGGRLADAWNALLDTRDPTAARLLASEAEAIWSADPPDDAHLRFDETMGRWALKQFRPGAGPLSPFERVFVALADVVSEFIGANPAVLGVGGNGERLVSALAGHLRELLPDPDAPHATGAGFFAERVLAILLRAGLRAADEQAGTLFEERPLRELTHALSRPLIDAFAGAEGGGRAALTELRDTLLGPMAQAALSSLARNQHAWLGRDFGVEDHVLGAVTGAALQVAAERPLRDLLADDGMVRLYRAALDLAAERPDLFVTSGTTSTRAVQELLSGLAVAAGQAAAPFGRMATAELATTVLAAIARNPMLLPAGEAARQAASGVLEAMAEGLRQAGLGDGLDRLFPQEARLSLARLLAERLAASPLLPPGRAGDGERQAIAGTVAAAIAAGMEATRPQPALLDAPDWLRVSEVIIDEALRDPERLVSRTETKPGRQLAVQVVHALLGAGGDAMRDEGRARGAVLFGDTLRDAIVIALRAASGDAGRMRQHIGALAGLAARLNAFVQANPQRAGRREWLLLFDRLLGRVLAEGGVPEWTDEALLALVTEAR